MPPVADHIRQVAITMEGQQAQFIHLDQKKHLKDVIEDICKTYNLNHPERYALRFDDEGNNRRAFITELNRTQIRTGEVLKLENSPDVIVGRLLEAFTGRSVEMRVQPLKLLCLYSADISFATPFIQKNGHTRLTSMIENNQEGGGNLGNLLKSFINLMNHGTVSWEQIVNDKFIKTVIAHISSRSGVKNQVAISASFEILQEIVLNTKKHTFIEKESNLSDILHHLLNDSMNVQKSCLGFVNALFTRADDNQKQVMANTLQHESKRSSFIEMSRSGSKSTDLQHELYATQQLLLNLLEKPFNTRIESDQTSNKQVSELLRIAFSSETENSGTGRRNTNKGDFRRLGFKDAVNPLSEIAAAPPGRLALDCMYYFATKHKDIYSKVILETSNRGDEHDCPFARCSCQLVLTLAQLMQLSEPVQDEECSFQPMMFTTEQPFHELFSVAIRLLCKTWKDMRATSADFDKVIQVVKEQLTLALQSKPLSFEGLWSKLLELPYSEILSQWQQQEKQREELESKAKPIVELRTELVPQVCELVRKQRLNYLVRGTEFPVKFSRSRTKQYWFCKLSSNHKVFTYSDCYENQPNNPESVCTHEVLVSDIRECVVGRASPLIDKNLRRSKENDIRHAFSFLLNNESKPSLDFIAATENDLNHWVDGVHILLGHEPCSERAVADRDMLMSMETKVRLLDTEGINIPEVTPPLPELPPNYNFVYQDA